MEDELTEDRLASVGLRIVPNDSVAGRLLAVLTDLDEQPKMTEADARLYFALERYLYPENEMFRPENLAATEARYLARAATA